MKHKLIKTENYLLVVSDEEVKVGDYQINHLTNKISKRTDNWLQVSKENCSKITCHLPLNGAPYLDGVDVLPEIEDNVSELADKYCTHKPINARELRDVNLVKLGFKDGYNKAKQTYKYTEADLRKAIDMATEEEFLDTHSKGYKYDSEDIIQSLNQPKLPVAFECGMEPIECPDNKPGCLVAHFGKAKITNSEGRTEWVGKYKF